MGNFYVTGDFTITNLTLDLHSEKNLPLEVHI